MACIDGGNKLAISWSFQRYFLLMRTPAPSNGKYRCDCLPDFRNRVWLSSYVNLHCYSLFACPHMLEDLHTELWGNTVLSVIPEEAFHQFYYY